MNSDNLKPQSNNFLPNARLRQEEFRECIHKLHDCRFGEDSKFATNKERHEALKKDALRALTQAVSEDSQHDSDSV